MRKLFVICILFAAIPAAAQKQSPAQARKKFHVSPAVGAMTFGTRVAARSMEFYELMVGYEIHPEWRLDLTGGYGSNRDRDVYTSAIMITPMYKKYERLIFNASIGAGFQKRSDNANLRFTVPAVISMGHYFTPSVGVALYTKVVVSGKNHSMLISGFSLDFRL